MMSDKEQSRKALRKMSDAWELFRRLVHTDMPGQAKVLDTFAAMARGKRRYR